MYVFSKRARPQFDRADNLLNRHAVEFRAERRPGFEQRVFGLGDDVRVGGRRSGMGVDDEQAALVLSIQP